jgi:hypothetical protein
MEKPLWLEEFQCNIPSRFSEPLPMALPSLFYLWMMTSPLPGETMEERCFQASQFTGWDPLERDPRTGRRLLHAVIENHAQRRLLDSREGDLELARLVQELLNKGCRPEDVFEDKTALELAMARELWSTARVLEPVSPKARQTVDQAQMLSELKAGFLENFIEIEGPQAFRDRMESTASLSDNGATLRHLHAAAFMGSAQIDGYYVGDRNALERMVAWIETHRNFPELAGFWTLSGLCSLARDSSGCDEGHELNEGRRQLLKAFSEEPQQTQQLLLKTCHANPIDGLIDRQLWGATLLGASGAFSAHLSKLLDQRRYIDGWAWTEQQTGELVLSLLEKGWDALFGGPLEIPSELRAKFASIGRIQWSSDHWPPHHLIVKHLQLSNTLWTTLGPMKPILDELCSAEDLTKAPWPVEQHPWLLLLTQGADTDALVARQCHLAATLAPSSERRPARL